MEHEPLVAGTPVRLVIHLTRTADFTPVTAGSLDVRIISTGGETYSVRGERPARPGIFLPVLEVPFSGPARMEIEVRGPQLNDLHILDDVTVHVSPAAIPHPEADEEDPTTITFLKEQQWQVDFANEPAALRRVRQAIPAAIAFKYPTSGQAILPAPASGIVRLASPEDGLEAGTHAAEGQALFVISPDSEWQAGLSQLRQDYMLARSELGRVQRLREEEAVADRRVEEARVRFETLRSAVERLGWEEIADDPGALRAKARAPIDGIVSDVFVVSGQRVAAGDPLALVVNPERLILEARVLSARLGAGQAIADVTFQLAGDKQRHRLSELGGRSRPPAPLVSQENNLTVARFLVDNPDRRFLAGSRGTAHLLVGDEGEERVAIPVSAIHEEDGLPIVFVQTAGESFVSRTVRLGAGDGVFTVVLSGIEEGERVVTRGGAFIRLASLTTTEMGHGHAH